MGKTIRIIMVVTLFLVVTRPIVLARAAAGDAALSEKHFPRLAPHIGRMNSDGTFGPVFPAIGSGFDGAVQGLVIQPDEKIIVIGNFSSHDGKKINRLVRLQSDGSVDEDFHVDPQLKIVSANSMALQQDGKLLLGGDFNLFNESEPRHLIRLNLNGTLDGDFTQNTAPSLIQPRVVMVSAEDHFFWQEYDDLAPLGGQVVNIENTPDGKRVIKHVINTAPCRKFSSVKSIVPQEDGKILLSGNFGGYRRLMRLNLNGSWDESFRPYTQTEPFSVYYRQQSNSDDSPDSPTIALQSDGKVLVGIAIRSSVSRFRILRLERDGGLDAQFRPVELETLDDMYTLKTIVLQADGKILLGGGAFGKINGIKYGAEQKIVRIYPDGRVDEEFMNLLGDAFNGYGVVYSVLVQNDGNILTGGSFASPSSGGIANVSADGHLDTSFVNNTVGGFAGGPVYCLALTEDGKIVVAGDFHTVKDPKRAFPQWNKCNGQGQCVVIPDSMGDWDVVNIAFSEDIQEFYASHAPPCEPSQPYDRYRDVPKPEAVCVDGVCTKKN